MTQIQNKKSKNFFKQKVIRIVLACFLSIGLLTSNGCSRIDFLYSISGWVILGKTRDYFDLSETQETFLDEKIDRLLDWHKKQELLKVITLLKQFNDRFKDGLTVKELEKITDEYDVVWDVLMKKLLPDWATFLSTVAPEQIKELPYKLNKRNLILEEKLKLSDAEWSEEDLESFQDTLEDWVGDLSKEQIEKIKGWVEQPDRNFVKIRLEQRRSFHKWFIEELKSNKTAKELEKSIGPWVIDPQSMWSYDFKTQMEKKKIEWTDLVINFDSTLTQKQRNAAIKKLTGYISSFEKMNSPN